MTESVQFLIRHGYTVIFAFVLAEQLGFPLPAIPVLLAAGAVAGAGHLNFGFVLAAAIAASLLADSFWYELGRRRGIKVLQLLCRISLEPDSCVRRTEDVFIRHGARSLLVAKFIPGINTAAPPLAGIFRMKYSRFLAFDSAGAFLWAGGFLGLGWLFSDQLERVADWAAQLGGWLLVILVGGAAGYIVWKYYQRQKFLRELRIARITAQELKQKIDAGEAVVVVDLRHRIDFEAEPEAIPGALHVPPEELEQRHGEIPRDRELILYCT
jgi:membrane protein DedA with SNARE-associated domain